jgi:hypothetical protein
VGVHHVASRYKGEGLKIALVILVLTNVVLAFDYPIWGDPEYEAEDNQAWYYWQDEITYERYRIKVEASENNGDPVMTLYWPEGQIVNLPVSTLGWSDDVLNDRVMWGGFTEDQKAMTRILAVGSGDLYRTVKREFNNFENGILGLSEWSVLNSGLIEQYRNENVWTPKHPCIGVTLAMSHLITLGIAAVGAVAGCATGGLVAYLVIRRALKQRWS